MSSSNISLEGKLLEKMTEIRRETKSSALYWIMTQCRVHWILGERQECLTWLYKARHLAWHKTDILDKVDQCLALFYDIDPNLLSSDYTNLTGADLTSFYIINWEHLPVVEEKLAKLTRRLHFILPKVEEASKRTRQKTVRLYLRPLSNFNWPLRQLECLMRAEFIAAYKCEDSVHDLIVTALLAVIKGD